MRSAVVSDEGIGARFDTVKPRSGPFPSDGRDFAQGVTRGYGNRLIGASGYSARAITRMRPARTFLLRKADDVDTTPSSWLATLPNCDA